jgi:ribonuclease D
MLSQLYTYDLPEEVDLGESIAIDTETMGLYPHRDRLCLIQICAQDGRCCMIHFPDQTFSKSERIKNVLKDDSVKKIFHYGRFDLAILMKSFDIFIQNIYCTKIASKLVRTYTDKHSLRHLCQDILKINLDKTEQTSDWGGPVLSSEQLKYSCSDVLYLHNLKEKLDILLEREKKAAIAQACFDFLPYMAKMDLFAAGDFDIFAH